MHRFALSIVILAVATASPGQTAPTVLTQPDPDALVFSFHGGADVVARVGALLDDADPVVRSHAAQTLGRTLNPRALEPLAKALRDADPAVRATAAVSVGYFAGERPDALLVEALNDQDPLVLHSALRVIVEQKRTALAGRVAALLDRRDDAIAAMALQALTALESPVAADRLAPLLRSPSQAVQLQATHHARLLSDARQLVEPLTALAKSQQPTLAGAAIAALGRLAYDASRPLIDEAAQSDSAVLRRAAALAHGYGGNRQAVVALLDDPSPGVQTAAIEAAGLLKLKDVPASLVKLAFEGSQAQAEAAAAVIVAAGDAAAAQPVADRWRKAIAALRGGSLRADEYRRLERQVRIGGQILAQLRSPAGNDVILEILKGRQVKLDEAWLRYVIRTAGFTGDEAVGDALVGRLDQAIPLAATALSSPAPVPYSNEVGAEIPLALGRLGRADAIERIDRLIRLGSSGLRLQLEPAAAMRAYVLLAGKGDAEKAAASIAAILADADYADEAAYLAAWAAGTLKIPAAVEPLRQIVETRKPHPQVMWAAAWALKQITGTAPEVGDARTKAPDDWILRPVR